MAGSFPMLAAAYKPRGEDELIRLYTNTVTKPENDESPALKDSPLTPEDQRQRGVSKTYRKLVFTDPVAFRYLEEDESTMVLARRHKLEGYELYVVEQWVVSRTHPTFTICTYTGDPSRTILVNVLAVPHDQSTWSQRLKVYFDAVSQSYARERETHLGTLMVTNLSGFPSALNVIPVPDGDVRKHREDFIVNENLKRMGCAGRAAMSLQYPQSSTITKFHHMYKTSEKIPLYASVLEIVRFCQIALVLYGKLNATYADGLLCDITEKSISEWWNEIGIDFHNVEPSDGIFGPTTVSALIGLLIGAYNRLKETGAPVGKDPIDLSSMKKAIEHFQKANKMARTRRLDRATLDRLHRMTANKVEDEGLAVTRALKSTVAGLSGKGGEMIARGFGGGKEKAGIAEVETLDIERLGQLVTGRSMKWLWQGKEKGLSSAGVAPPPDELNGRVFSADDQGNFIWTSQVKEGADDLDFITSADPEEKEKRGGRLREAVGLGINKPHGGSRGHHTDDEVSKQDHLSVPTGSKENGHGPHTQRSSRSTSREDLPPFDLSLASLPVTKSKPESLQSLESGREHAGEQSNGNLSGHRQAPSGTGSRDRDSPTKGRVREELASIREDLKGRRYTEFSATVNIPQPSANGLRRSRSAIQLRSIQLSRVAKLPRHLSFSLVSDAVEASSEDDLSPATDIEQNEDLAPARQMKITKERLRRAQDIVLQISQLQNGLVPYTTSRIERVEYIESEARDQLEELNSIYYQHLEEYQVLQATSTDLVAREKASLSEALRSIEMLGQKLDYELDSLGSKMQEVEESVDDFERRVLDIEASVKTLIAEEEKDNTPAWYERWLSWPRFQKAERWTGSKRE